MPERLESRQFKEVVRLAPLISIDLIVKDEKGRILVGRRTNAPAKGKWFVPGGCIRKGERIPEALARIAEDELGIPARFDETRFLSVCEHHYDTNFAEEEGYGTHYVVLVFELKIPEINPASLPGKDQHSDWRLEFPDRLLADPDVHEYTKAYFGLPGSAGNSL